MSRILITGGTGTLGSALLPLLTQDTVRIMSRSPRKAGYDSRIEWAQANIETGDGLAEAVHGVDVIIHAASNAFKSHEADVRGTERLLVQAKAAGVKHFIYISIVGIERIPFAYYKAKVETEHVVEHGGVPYTILRATQFHELMEKMFLLGVVKLPLLGFVPKDYQFQLIDVREVAARLAEIAQGDPLGRAEDIGGPEIMTLEQIARQWMKATGKRKLLINAPLFRGETAEGFRKGYNTTPDNRYGKITWVQWLAEQYGGEPIPPNLLPQAARS